MKHQDGKGDECISKMGGLRVGEGSEKIWQTQLQIAAIAQRAAEDLGCMDPPDMDEDWT